MARPAGTIGFHSSAHAAPAADDPRLTAAEFPANQAALPDAAGGRPGVELRVKS